MSRFQKGCKPGPGRPPGLPNKSTAEIRSHFSKLVEDNLEKMGSWLDEIKDEEGAKSAMETLLKLAEYVLPKQKSIEIKDKESKGTVLIIKPPKKEDEE